MGLATGTPKDIVHTPNRPCGKKTNLLSQYYQGFGIVTRGLPRLWRDTSTRSTMKMTQVWPLRNGTRQQILMIRRLRWQWSSTLQNCSPLVSNSEKWYLCNSRCRRVGDNVHSVWPSIRFTTWIPGGMYSPWITIMSSGHDMSEYELDASGLPRPYVSPQQPWKNWLIIQENHDFFKKKNSWFANHDRTHSLKIRLMNEGRCDERLKVELRSLHVSHTLDEVNKRESCLLLIDKARTTDKTNMWVSVR